MVLPLRDYVLILASKSSRRQMLLKMFGVPIEIRVKEINEDDYPKELPLAEIPLYLAQKKAEAFDQGLLGDKEILISADTVVIHNQHIMGKPNDHDQAVEMLRRLSGQAHEVITGCCICTREKKRAFTASTKVFFRQLSEEEIHYYIETYKPYDKAGSYGIQEWIGCVGVERIEGSFYNVMGLPLQQLYIEIEKLLS